MKDTVRVASAVPRIKIGNCAFNTGRIKEYIKQAVNGGARIVLFPELSVTGYTCGDLFFQESLAAETVKSAVLAAATVPEGVVALFGLPLEVGGQLYNCAAVCSGGLIIGIVPKTFLPNYGEFYEKRWFSPGSECTCDSITINGRKIPMGTDLVFTSDNGINIAAEICEDLWAPIPPSTFTALGGANLILNLSASNEIIAKREYRKRLVEAQSGACFAAYMYTGAGSDESTSDLIFSGHTVIAVNGSTVCENQSYIANDYLIMSDLDMGRVMADRKKHKTFKDGAALYGRPVRTVPLGFAFGESDMEYMKVDKLPFVPSDRAHRTERCMQIFDMQAAALARRLSVTGGKVTVGISGGLDSTLALLAATKSMEQLGLPRTNITGITMPCFGTTRETKSNAIELMETLGVSSATIDISSAVTGHFKDIGQESDKYDVVFENCQARERTQVLMDVANKDGSIVLGTGDLSELALGWCTYNADHMSMYGINSGIPKTLVRWIIASVTEADLYPKSTAVLSRILDTPISPELLPPDATGKIAQRTEDIVGPYALHDFFLYYAVRFGYSPEKIYALACRAFDTDFDKTEIKKWLVSFYKRFFTQQFKRNCLPDGVKIGSIALSPRGDWRMPSDADCSMWVRQASEL